MKPSYVLCRMTVPEGYNDIFCATNEIRKNVIYNKNSIYFAAVAVSALCEHRDRAHTVSYIEKLNS